MPSIPERRLNPSQQSAMILQRFNNFRLHKRGHSYVWDGEVRPTARSRNYLVRVEYRQGEYPRITVLDPVLEDGPKPIPHRYREGTLCLHRTEDWSSKDFIAHTIIPWISLWLYFYEQWLIHGEWLGGGDPVVSKPKNDSHE